MNRDNRRQRRLARAHPIFGVLPFGDIDVASHRASERPVPSVLRNARGQKPSVVAVGVAQSILQVERPPGVERRGIGVNAPLDVLGMDKVQPAVLSQLVRPAGPSTARRSRSGSRVTCPAGPSKSAPALDWRSAGKLLEAPAQRSSLDEQAERLPRREFAKPPRDGGDDEGHKCQLIMSRCGGALTTKCRGLACRWPRRLRAGFAHAVGLEVAFDAGMMYGPAAGRIPERRAQ